MTTHQTIPTDRQIELTEQPSSTNANVQEPHSPELIGEKDLAALRAEWDATQSMFVDDPQTAVARADELAIRVLAAISDAITRERAALRQRWSQSAATNTEELRVCLQQYRSLFERLLSGEPGPSHEQRQ